MTQLVTAALMGFFVVTNIGVRAASVEAQVPQEPTYPTYTVRMTGYNAVPEQTDSDPFTTASGAYSNPEIVAARSVDLMEELPFGTVIEVVAHGAAGERDCGFALVEDRIGYRVIADSMHPRKRNQIDLLFETERDVYAGGRWVNPAVALGICTEIEIRVVGRVDIASIPKTQRELALAVEGLQKADTQFLAVRAF